MNNSNLEQEIMKKYTFFLLFILIFTQCDTAKINMESETNQKFAIVIHGGAGTILKKNMTPEMELEYKRVLELAINTGYAILKNGGSSLDAVEKTINILEDSPLFNAGKGAVFTNQGKNELDASIMDGKTLKAGAIAGVTTVKNPINLARAVMEKSEHVMLSREGAEFFASQHNIELVNPAYFMWKVVINRYFEHKKKKKQL